MWLWGALMPHPPILIPQVGRGREREAQKTLDGLHALVATLSDKKPDYLLLFSPHHPYTTGELLFNAPEHISEDLAAFGAPSVHFNVEVSAEKTHTLYDYFLQRGMPTCVARRQGTQLDHGTLVPLYFLREKWGTLPPIVVASPMGLSYQNALTVGNLLRAYDDGAQWGFVASGDLSHRLIPSAPAGYHPASAAFDQAVVAALTNGSPDTLLNLPAQDIEDAGECGLRSVLSLLSFANSKIDVLSYEGPFGVGYCNAVWINHSTISYPAIARHVVVAYLSGKTQRMCIDLAKELYRQSGQVDALKTRKACFVSIHRSDGSLRGCIGTLEPHHNDLIEELVANAIAAATQDPRFMPIHLDELLDVSFSVDVLSVPEPAQKTDLDPEKWGVIVRSGHKRGVLLPDLDGVDTVDYQLQIALQKAGISPNEDYGMERFSVERQQES